MVSERLPNDSGKFFYRHFTSPCVAWDIGIFQGGQYLPESPLYRQAGNIGKGLGLEWGGDWTRFRDEPHFQVVREDDLTEIAAKFQEGTAFV
jgi:peptidoglycan L-alanyl-D-glutamate endopeptidase CwlK